MSIRYDKVHMYQMNCFILRDKQFDEEGPQSIKNLAFGKVIIYTLIGTVMENIFFIDSQAALG